MEDQEVAIALTQVLLSSPHLRFLLAMLVVQVTPVLAQVMPVPVLEHQVTREVPSLATLPHHTALVVFSLLHSREVTLLLLDMVLLVMLALELTTHLLELESTLEYISPDSI
jgi:hypothetical protein